MTSLTRDEELSFCPPKMVLLYDNKRCTRCIAQGTSPCILPVGGAMKRCAGCQAAGGSVACSQSERAVGNNEAVPFDASQVGVDTIKAIARVKGAAKMKRVKGKSKVSSGGSQGKRRREDAEAEKEGPEEEGGSVISSSHLMKSERVCARETLSRLKGEGPAPKAVKLDVQVLPKKGGGSIEDESISVATARDLRGRLEKALSMCFGAKVAMEAAITRAKVFEMGHSLADHRMAGVVGKAMEPIVEWLELGLAEGRKLERMEDPTKAREEARLGIQWNGAVRELWESMELEMEELLRKKERLESVKEVEDSLGVPLPGEDEMLM